MSRCVGEHCHAGECRGCRIGVGGGKRRATDRRVDAATPSNTMRAHANCHTLSPLQSRAKAKAKAKAEEEEEERAKE